MDRPHAPVLAILTRAPSAGGKSRLFQALGATPDRRLLTALLLDTLDNTSVRGVHRVLVVTPGSACDEVAALAGGIEDIEVMPQPEGDLGERMRTTMAALFARGAPVVALIGSDVPHVDPASVRDAFDLAARGSDGIVLGPAVDGGYYLMAAQRLPAVFGGVEWGGRDVFVLTVGAAADDGFRIHLLPPLADVDTPEALRAAALSGRAPRTAAWMRARGPVGRSGLP